MTQMCLEEISYFIPFEVGIAVNGSRQITARARTQSMPMGMPPGSRQGSYVGHGYMYPSYAQIQRGSDNPRVHSGSAELLTVGAVLITVRKRWADAGMALAAGPTPCQRLDSDSKRKSGMTTATKARRCVVVDHAKMAGHGVVVNATPITPEFGVFSPPAAFRQRF